MFPTMPGLRFPQLSVSESLPGALSHQHLARR